MSDSRKAGPRKSGLDATPHAAPPETSADDTAAGPASQTGTVAEPEPAPASGTPEPAAEAVRSVESPPQTTAQVIDLGAVRADERKATLAYVAEVHELCALAGRGDLAAGFVAKATPVPQVRPASVEPAQPAIDTAAIYAARNQNVR